ncbi:hypothetical protein QE422_002847 [Chryseobacterium sp. SORGH_AS 447]|uniref:hypothetical protein n=1 Tax=Chryseobacterium sp. SORGH_AS_0447 TaxID=3041769 RepID=UPI0027803A8F|nr:hypothetical protein [Chryseobacterium sp. SORGH_AS_0447]MDQ1162479.1 hypothetical protein [Chryseobacterium sp. SORGH_AS_0447]
MNNKIKVALGLIAGGSLIYFGLKKKNGKVKTFTAPDGNTYGENQLYRTFDNKLFKNGKEVHFNTPESEGKGTSSSQYEANNEKLTKNYQAGNQNVNYHQKGVRHH